MSFAKNLRLFVVAALALAIACSTVQAMEAETGPVLMRLSGSLLIKSPSGCF